MVIRMYCTNCGKEIPSDSRFCPECGFGVAGQPEPEPERPRPNVRYETKSDALALILSIILPGVGHIYVGALKKGLTIMVAYVLLIVLTIALFFVSPFISFAIPVLSFVLLIYAVYDAYQVTKTYNDSIRDTGHPPW